VRVEGVRGDRAPPSSSESTADAILDLVDLDVSRRDDKRDPVE
jgi:hypothetical protein